jgi:hypothetical protein
VASDLRLEDRVGFEGGEDGVADIGEAQKVGRFVVVIDDVDAVGAL